MNRERLVFALLKPLDLQLGVAISALKRMPGYDRVQNGVYRQLRRAFRANFERQNDLEVEGADNIPEQGGFVLASNHQSWNDVPSLGAACPRRLHFLAKSELRNWPVLRRMIELSESPYIARSGDTEGLARIVELLRSGKPICIFPEGTIPGEEKIGRNEVEPHTGLLRGRSGAVRIALAAGVPIVPVGVSGTGASLPPEVYPRLELVRLPSSSRITVRFGEPIHLDDHVGRDLEYSEIRELTDRVMQHISGLVDHQRNYIPMSVPIEPLPRFDKLGVLLLHGFTSSVKTIDGLVPYLKDRGIEWSLPVLRGHGTDYRDMVGTTAADWYADAEKALLELSEKVDKVVVVGLSMGGLVALDLGMRHPKLIAGVVTLAAALRFKDPLSALTKPLSKVVKFWPSPDAFVDPECAKANENYPKFATDAFASLYDYAREIERRLPTFEVPILVLQSKKDQVVAPVAANVIYERVCSAHRDIRWFHRSGHELGQDLEAEAAFDAVDEYIGQFDSAAASDTAVS